MDTRTLVAPDIDLGERLTKALRSDPSFDLRAAMWWLDETSGEMRFLVATPIYSRLGPTKAYEHVIKALNAVGLSDFPAETIWIVEPNHKIVAAFRRLVSPEATHVKILGGNFFGLQNSFAHIYYVAKAKAGTSPAKTRAGTRKKRTP